MFYPFQSFIFVVLKYILEKTTNLFDKLNYIREKPKGLILVLINSLFVYFIFIVDRIKELLSFSLEIYYIFIPILILLIIFFFWMINTNRLNWIKRKKITIGLFIKKV